MSQLSKRLAAARHFPSNTTAESRHLELMAEALAKGEVYHMFTEEPRYCAETMQAVLVELYELKNALPNYGYDITIHGGKSK